MAESEVEMRMSFRSRISERERSVIEARGRMETEGKGKVCKETGDRGGTRKGDAMGWERKGEH